MSWSVLRGIVVGALVCAGCTSADAGPDPSDTVPASGVDANATVERIVDGDTIDVVIDGRDERVRLIGIDTPETKRPDTPVECFGPEATAHIDALLPTGTPIRIERDIVGRDHFDRLLGYVYRADDGLFVNVEMIRAGFAQPLSIPPNETYRSVFVEAARTAERQGVGLWSACAS
ncbi:MAG: thermonuclease family protein [Ilumatobacter sp.]|jgi:micrococcal nuclease|uniref:thermonuclease family protein n=1 Tax=Ilumatobacter sp. TaxID=1967498 RepID=UPI003919CC4F